MFTKFHMSRAQTRAMSIDYPIGDPTGGAAYREMRDPITAGIAAVSTIAGGVISSNAASKASRAQRDAAKEANEVNYKISQEQLAAQKEALDRQIAASGATVDKQLLAQRDTLEQQLAFQKQIYEQQRTDLAPYRDAGLAGQNKLLNYLGIGPIANAGTDPNYGKYATAEFTPEMFAEGKDPGYNFRLSEGLKGIDRQAAARGGLISGNALKAASGYAGEQASQEFTNAYNRYQNTRGNTLSPYERLQGVGLNASNMTGNAGATYGGAGGQAIGASGQGASNAYGAMGNSLNTAYGNFGQGTTGILGAYGTNTSNNLIGAGNARASGYIGQANAFNQGVSGLTNAYYQNQMLEILRNRNNAGSLGGAP